MQNLSMQMQKLAMTADLNTTVDLLTTDDNVLQDDTQVDRITITTNAFANTIIEKASLNQAVNQERTAKFASIPNAFRLTSQMGIRSEAADVAILHNDSATGVKEAAISTTTGSALMKMSVEASKLANNLMSHPLELKVKHLATLSETTASPHYILLSNTKTIPVATLALSENNPPPRPSAAKPNRTFALERENSCLHTPSSLNRQSAFRLDSTKKAVYIASRSLGLKADNTSAAITSTSLTSTSDNMVRLPTIVHVAEAPPRPSTPKPNELSALGTIPSLLPRAPKLNAKFISTLDFIVPPPKLSAADKMAEINRESPKSLSYIDKFVQGESIDKSIFHK